MAKKLCKCSVCGLQFDRNAVQAVKSGARRYAHYDCMPDGELVPMEDAASADPELAALKEYITNLFGSNANWKMIMKQIKDYTTQEGYSISGILKSLVYFYEVKHGDKTKANGSIGIVPFIYKDAYNYYYALYMAQNQNESVVVANQIKEVIIAPPQKRGTKRRFLEWELSEDE